MKGVSLAIETIIFIILAVTVLSVLLLFLTGTGGKAQTQIELENERNIFCGQYVRQKPQCNNIQDLTGIDTAKFVSVCKKLNAKGCDTAQATAQCFAECCRLFCIKK